MACRHPGWKGGLMKRHKTKYPGVFYREADRIGGPGKERVYYIVFKRDGKVVEEKVGRQYADDMTPARAARIRAERIEGKRQSRKELREAAKEVRWTLDRLFGQYMSDKPDTKGYRTDRYRYAKFLGPILGRRKPQEISPMDIHRLRLTLSKSLQPKTVKNVLELLSRIVNFGFKRALCPRLSFKVEMPKVHNLKTEDLSPEQLRRLLVAIEQDHDIQAANFMRLALATGMRRSELLRLKWTDLDFDKGFIHLRQTKSGRDHTIPMNSWAREILSSHPRTDSLFVFPSPRTGGMRVEIRRSVNRIRQRAGLPPDFRPLHGLRHTFATLLASSGDVNIYLVQRLLTHTNPATTMRYAHLRDETLRRASEKAAEIINGAANTSETLPLQVAKD